MAKIIVTEVTYCNGKVASKQERLVDTNCKFFRVANNTVVVDANGKWTIAVEESLEEIRKRVNVAEAEGINQKLDLILQSQEAILRLLSVDPFEDESSDGLMLN